MIFHLGEKVSFKYDGTETWYGTIMSPVKDGDYLIGFDKKYHNALHTIDGVKNAYWLSGDSLEFVGITAIAGEDNFWIKE